MSRTDWDNPPYYSDGRMDSFADWQWRAASAWGRMTGLIAADRARQDYQTRRGVLTSLPVLSCGFIVILAMIVFGMTA